MKFFKIIFLFFFNFSIIAFPNLKNLDIEIIAPSSGIDIKTWNKVFKITGKKSKIKTKSSDDQIFVNQSEKFKDFEKSIKSDRKILWALRGGYGIDKIMPEISNSNYSNAKKKILIGYSDISTLLIHFSQKYHWICLNAPMLKDFVFNNKSSKSYEIISEFLKNIKLPLNIPNLLPINSYAKNMATIKGKTTGGNLTCIISGIGTPWQIKTTNKILFIEDTNVSGYQLDRLLTHIKNAGLLENVKAVIFGDFGTNVSKILKTFANHIKIPVYVTNYFGHQKHNYCWGYEFNGIIQKTADVFYIKMTI